MKREQNISEKRNEIIVKAAEDKLARDINVLPIREDAGICDYFIIMTGRNKNHTNAIAEQIVDRLAEEKLPVRSEEGLREGSWILLDCEDTIVHIFTENEREYYDLDELWSE